ncbi:MAG TPA: hypothetical protein VFB54_20815 [Burkholderiales bacterium]|nr:hypothetical protein [Burkholderiales bacterium]
MHYTCLWLGGSLVAVTALLSTSAAAIDAQPYGFTAAAQEITQLYWLAETASVCGWASESEASRFKGFSLRFLVAHLPSSQGSALESLVRAVGYADGVRRAAEDGAKENCDKPRWQQGWLAYKAAADEHEHEY